MEHFYQRIEGWFDYQATYRQMVIEAPEPAHFVEVGVHLGRSAAFMSVEIINSGKNILFDCVDPWTSVGEDNNFYYKNDYQTFLDNLIPVHNHYRPIRAFSPEVSILYQDESLDFVWIDAEHTYEAVTKDVIAWLPKIKKGGYIGGHDYNLDCGKPMISAAITELLPDHKEIPGEDESGLYAQNNWANVSSWLYQKI